MNDPRAGRDLVVIAALVMALIVVVYGASTTRQSAERDHDPGRPEATDAVLRVVNAHDLPVRLAITGHDGETRELWPVGPGSDHVFVSGGTEPTALTISSHSFSSDETITGTHRFTARADVAEALLIGNDGSFSLHPEDRRARAGHHTLWVRVPIDGVTARAWAWTAGERENRLVASNEKGDWWSQRSAFVPQADVTISWEVAGPLHTRSEELVFEPGSAHEIIVDRDGRWSHREPGALRAWWMRR